MLLNASVFAENDDKSEPLKGSAVIINLKSDKIKYIPEKDQFIATGHVKVDIEDAKTTIESDEMILDQANQVMISEKNVKITKHGTIIYGDYAKFDINSDSGFINKPDVDLTKLKIVAETAQIVSQDVELLKGKAIINDKDLVMVLSTGSFGKNANNNRLFQNQPTSKPRINYDIKSQEILIDEYNDYNIITLKNAVISINKFKIAKIPVIQLTTDKEDNRIETMLPEFGHHRILGSYLGHGHVFHLKKGSTLKALPIISWGNDGVGIGAMGRYMSRTNKTEALYSTLRNRFVVEGEQDLNFISPDTKLIYGTNSYMNNGFFGDQDPQYLVEVVDERKIAEAYNYSFWLRSSGGYAEELGNFSTGKFQVQGSIYNVAPLFGYRKFIDVGLSSNFALAAYGTGDSYGVLRAGPTIASKIGPVSLWAAYYQGTIYGETPFLYDRYLYGKSNVQLVGDVRINKYLTMGYITSLNLSKDNWNEQLVTENQIYAWVGPDELKFKIGYDVERARTVFGFDMLVGSESSAFEFDKLKVIQR